LGKFSLHMHRNELYFIISFFSDLPCYPSFVYFSFAMATLISFHSTSLARETMTSGQAVVHTILSNNDPEVSFWHDPILSDDIPVRNVVKGQVELDLLSLPWLERHPDLSALFGGRMWD
jgi:hypothetical protein